MPYGADQPAACLAEVFQKTRVVNRWHKDPWLAGFETKHSIRLRPGDDQPSGGPVRMVEEGRNLRAPTGCREAMLRS